MRRIIPARAGFTPTCAFLRFAQADHPRSRGVYGDGSSFLESAGGSSPLARGLRALLLLARVREGIIPARAGFTTARSG